MRNVRNFFGRGTTLGMFSFVAIFLLTAHCSLMTLCAAFDQRGVGARALSLGGAFVGAQNDGSSVYWNPAAMTTLKTKEVEFMYTDLYSKGLISFSHVAFAYPGFGPGGFGISWTRLGVTNKVPFDYSEHTYTFSYGLKLHGKFSAGTSLNYFKLNANIKGSAFGVHVGMLYRPFKFLSLGGLYQNLVRTPLRYESGAVDTLQDNLKLGAVASVKEIKLLVDVDRSTAKRPLLHFGVEVPLYKDYFDLRSGVSRRSADGFNLVYSVGFGARTKHVGVDYAFENHFDLGMSHIVSVKWRF